MVKLNCVHHWRTTMWNGFLLSVALLLVPVSARKPVEKHLWVPDSKWNLHFVKLLRPLIQDLTFPFFNGETKVNLSLYTQRNPTEAQRITLNDDSAFPNFNPTKPTRFMVHGWLGSEAQYYYLRDAYFKAGLDYNIVLVDWRLPAHTDYYFARMYTRLVGEYLAKVIQHLVEKKNFNLDNVFVMGHSLGAHVAGVAGNRLHGKLARIVGLDPASPLFGFTPRRNRLDRSDAAFVQVIHTDGGVLGWLQPIGHADFFINGGTSQPGCGFNIPGCSHRRSALLYAESIGSKNLVGRRCRSYFRFALGECEGNPTAIMGEWTPDTVRGNYYLTTLEKPPFAIVSEATTHAHSQ